MDCRRCGEAAFIQRWTDSISFCAYNVTMALDILITGGSGYIGRHLIPILVARGHRVRALARAESAQRVAPGASTVIGNALDAVSVGAALKPGDTIIHLVGTPHPSPTKADQFEKVDLVSIRATVTAAKQIDCRHIIYVSVAQPAPVMQAYLRVRALGEAMIYEGGFTATIVRPWYVLGPGHWWPKALVPLYKLLEAMPATRAGAQRLGLVTIDQMVTAIIDAAENPPQSGQQRIVDVPAIRRARL